MKKTNLLWADDDCNGFLSPLGRILERNGFILTKVTNYVSAMERLKEGRPAENMRIEALLVDIILPHAEGSGALASDLGITLAQRSLNHGVTAIAFLTVVRRDEVIDKYSQLQRDNPNLRLSYFDKTTLLEHKEIDSIIQHLQVNREEPNE